MQKNELEQKLLQEEVSKDLYSLKGGLPNESYCFNEQNGVWEEVLIFILQQIEKGIQWIKEDIISLTDIIQKILSGIKNRKKNKKLKV